MNLKFLLLSAVLLTACQHKLPTPPGAGQEEQLPQWPVWGGNLRHTANAADPVEYYVGPSQGVEGWNRKLFDITAGAPSIHSDGTIYVASSPASSTADSAFVYAFLPDGTQKWRFKTDATIYTSGALDQEGTYYVVDTRGGIYAITASGEMKWKRKVETSLLVGHPALTRYGLLICAFVPGLFAFDKDTGEEIWQVPVEGDMLGGVSIGKDGTIYAGTRHSLVAFTAEGRIKWQLPLSQGPFEVMIGPQGTLYFQIQGDSTLYAYNPDGTLKWTYDVGCCPQYDVPALSKEGNIYVIQKRNLVFYLVVLNPAGKEVKRFNLFEIAGDRVGRTTTWPIVDAENTIYVHLFHGTSPNWYAIQDSGEIKWQALVAPQRPFNFDFPVLAPDGALCVVSVHRIHYIK
ncbi:MAG: hypothetical protein D6814_15130 [Calditrichaeota bacterium]|nr:MAG: hypothetical protein D6814_15130 [Calditrichota bacterium]